ncbi:antibiotic biosynthesis monooxygenase [Simiduia sp. 21SJ11W-1]|uniref:antibiotic biosynthesis monooxygenase family protein n=1 Tax=Simiduia sp. 21SJ11W-1 TaxID=2909669 RepID=UPI0020A21C12|nr:antibiotic biosynthesis monooxygenase [Simiduia sp. 21SJ11W-1]UTA47793.1 antibiotic biosynthesis monooxygenase [Simiduia sp. 21SJ11W-1]
MKFIFEVTVAPTHTPEDYAQAWVRASQLIQTYPGAMGTELHRKIGEPNKLIAIAHWQSKTDRDAMEADNNPEVKTIIQSAADFVSVKLIGEFEEPEWVVKPEG